MVLLVQVLDWRPPVLLGCAAVLALALELVLLRVPTSALELAWGARPLLGLL